MDEFCSFSEVKKLADDFEAVLRDRQITISHGSELERLCLIPTDIVDKYLRPEIRSSTEDIRPYFREFLGIHDLMVKIVKSSSHTFFSQLIPHLKKLNNSSPLQNLSTSVLNQDNNKAFELFIATLCLNASTDEISVDHPDASKGDNPDVIAVFEGRKWGFGCKVLHSDNIKTIIGNIEKAVDQIEKSGSEIGMPVISMKNIINHDDFWPLLNPEEFRSGAEPVFRSFLDLKLPMMELDKYANEFREKLFEELKIDGIRDLFYNKKSQPVCLLYFPTTTSVIINDMPVATRLNIFRLLSFSDQPTEAEVVAEKMNHELQLIR